jgi:hypothetical protein
MTHFAILNVSASLDDLKPIHIPNALVSLRNGSIDCFLNVCFRRTDNFDYFVNMICHYCSSAVACRIRKRPAEASRFCWLCVAGARLIVRLFGIFITLARGLALLAGFLAGDATSVGPNTISALSRFAHFKNNSQKINEHSRIQVRTIALKYGQYRRRSAKGSGGATLGSSA